MWAKVGERLNKIRTERKQSKAKFGEMIGLSGQYIGMIEKGTHSLSVDSIIKICRATGVSADYILFGTVDPAQDPSTTAALHGLSNDQIHIALDIIKKVASFINTDDGNEALIKEVASQQNTVVTSDE